MCDYKEKREFKEHLDKLRCREILNSIICDFEENRIEKDDFDKDVNEILQNLKSIRISNLQRYNQVDDLEMKLYNLMDENFILYIPAKSKLILRMEKIYKEKYCV